MKYYIFKCDKVGSPEEQGYGFLTEDIISEDTKKYAFKVLDSLPATTQELDGREYYLIYDEANDVFSWKQKL